jgi:hypothetical protein
MAKQGKLKFVKILKAASMPRRKRQAAPGAKPRVTSRQALQALKRFRGGPQIIAKLERAGIELQAAGLVQFAAFTPKTKSGSAHWIDFWNADLFDGTSNLTQIHSADRVQFRTDRYTWRGERRVLNVHVFGGAQASFNMPQAGFFLGAVVVSSTGGWVAVDVDDHVIVTSTPVNGNGVMIPVAVQQLAAGNHWISVIQGPFPGSGHLWFHGITCYRWVP